MIKVVTLGIKLRARLLILFELLQNGVHSLFDSDLGIILDKNSIFEKLAVKSWLLI